jgi:hypothetical protein
MGAKDNLHKLVAEFLLKVPSIKKPQFRGEFAAREVYPSHDEENWRGKPGVYYFRVGDEIRYVGQSTGEHPGGGWGTGSTKSSIRSG